MVWGWYHLCLHKPRAQILDIHYLESFVYQLHLNKALKKEKIFAIIIQVEDKDESEGKLLGF